MPDRLNESGKLVLKKDQVVTKPLRPGEDILLYNISEPLELHQIYALNGSLVHLFAFMRIDESLDSKGRSHVYAVRVSIDQDGVWHVGSPEYKHIDLSSLHRVEENASQIEGRGFRKYPFETNWCRSLIAHVLGRRK